MARFDLYRLPDGRRYVVDIQSDVVSAQVRTRVVVPLLPAGEMAATISGLNPVLSIGGKDHVFVAQSLATMTKAEMGDQIGTVLHHYDDLLRSLDLLLSGF